MSGKKLDDSWTAWLKENIDRQCKPEQLVDILLKNQFSIDTIRAAMGDAFPAHAGTLAEPAIDYDALAHVRLTRPGSGVNAVKIPDKLQLYVIENFLSENECDTIIDIINRSLRPSTTTRGDADPGYRTSQTSDLARLKDPAVEALDEKIARAIGIHISHSESIQAQRYDIGGEFKQHTDYFKAGTPGYEGYLGANGNRTWTFMVYLNSVPRGGGTKFFAIDKVFSPVRGTAVIWNNRYPDGAPNPDTLHAGLPVEEGHKIIITKWFREKGAGPMFYGE